MGSFKVFNRGSKKKEKEKEKKVPGKLSQDIRPNSNISQLKTPPVLAGLLKNILDQQIRGVKIRMECRTTEEIQKEAWYLEINESGKVQASHDGNSDQTVMVLVPVGMACNYVTMLQ